MWSKMAELGRDWTNLDEIWRKCERMRTNFDKISMKLVAELHKYV